LQGEQYSKAASRFPSRRAADLTPKHRLLLEFVETLTRHAYRITDDQVQRLREAGWTDAQIAEAVYDGALFNLFVRLADAFDIHPDPSYDATGLPGVLSRPDGPDS
jgi:alkylhydroperoxidase family enzyme